MEPDGVSCENGTVDGRDVLDLIVVRVTVDGGAAFLFEFFVFFLLLHAVVAVSASVREGDGARF